MNTLPIFSSTYSIGKSILTLDPPDKTKETGTKSIFYLAKKYGINPIYLVDNSFTGFPEFYRVCEEQKLKGRFGLKMTILEKGDDKSEESLGRESKVILWAKNSAGYGDLVKISTAATEYFYYRPRLDHDKLKSLWTPNLKMTMPFYSSFLTQNIIKFYKCFVDTEFFKPVFEIQDNLLPFDALLKESVINFTEKSGLNTINTKSILYEKREDFDAAQTMACIINRSNLECPNLDSYSSAEFCIESWKDNEQV
jgi:DNA polymerase III alpha subunit